MEELNENVRKEAVKADGMGNVGTHVTVRVDGKLVSVANTHKLAEQEKKEAAVEKKNN